MIRTLRMHLIFNYKIEEHLTFKNLTDFLYNFNLKCMMTLDLRA